MRKIALAFVLFMLALADAHAQTGCSSASTLVTGGGSSGWFFCNTFGTTNGLPAGGSATSGTGASIDDAALGDQGDAFDDGGNIWVNNTVIGGALSQAATSFGTSVSFAGQSVGGVQASLRYDVLSSQPTLRILASFANAGSTQQSITVTYTTNLGSDSSSFIRQTSTNDTIFSTDDRWAVSSDDFDDDPVNTTAIRGNAAPVPPDFTSTAVYDNFGTQGILARFPLTVPAGSTVKLMFFQRLSATRSVAIAAATDFDNLSVSSPLVAGLTPTELGQIKNWALGSANPPTVSVSVNPSRLTVTGVATINWTAANSNGCVVSGGAAGSNFNVTQTPTSGSATTNVTVGANPRNDTFFVQCTGPGGTIKGSTSLAVGAAPPPPARPVAVQSAGIGGAAANAKASNVSLSDGGRFVAFETAASNMVANDTNGGSDVFVRDTSNGTLRRVSVDTGGTQLNSVSGEARITRDGRFVAFTRGSGQTAALGTKAITGGQVCVNDLNGNALFCVSKSPGGAAGNGDSGKPSISGDGKVTVFESKATNLTATPDPNGAITDVFAYNKDTNTNTILSNASNGTPSTANSGGPSVSCNGKNYAFETLAQLATGATQPGVRNIISISSVGGIKRLVTVGTGGAASNGDSRAPKITDDGRFVYFESASSNLVGSDTNGATDIYQADLLTNTIKRMSVSATGVQANAASRNASMTCDGSYVTFESDASNLVAGDTNGTTDTFILNTATGTMALESKTNAGGATNGPSTNGQVSPDGSVVGYDSNAGNLGSTSGGSVFSGQNPFSVQNFTGVWYDPAQSGHGLFLESLPNGQLLAWWFTFDPASAQAWFGGTGPQNGSTATVSVVRTQGARFAPNFNPSDAKSTPIGTLTFTFTSCDQGRVDFALDSTFGTGFMNLKRLTGPVGTNCTPGQATSLDEGTKRIMAAIDTVGPPTLYPLAGMPKALEPTVGPIAGITGVWYNPAQSGQGLFFENLGNGSVLAWWFTFGPTGGQAWFGGAGTITGPNTATLNFTKTQGGKWIPNFNPANVTSPALGPVTLTVTDCSNASVNYSFGQGFGNGVFTLVPLTRPVGAICDD